MLLQAKGQRYEAAIRIIIRATEALDSPQLRYAARGSMFELISVGDLPRRVCVRDVSSGEEGWASLSKENGDELLRPVDDVNLARDASKFDATGNDARSILGGKGDITDTTPDGLGTAGLQGNDRHRDDTEIISSPPEFRHEDDTSAEVQAHFGRPAKAIDVECKDDTSAEVQAHFGRPAKAIDVECKELNAAGSDAPSHARATIGERYETTTTVLMRLSESLLSSSVGQILPGIVLQVLEIGAGRRVRVRVCQDSHIEGWVSLTRTGGEALLRLCESRSVTTEAVRRPAVKLASKSGCGTEVCDKCDGNHQTDRCPNFKGGRDEHKDAWTNYGKGGSLHSMGGGGGSFTLGSARVVRQPGDGSCLFHSLNYGLGASGAASAGQLRGEIASFLHRNPNLEIAGDTLEEWVRYDGGMSISSYASRMSAGGWGGGIEMAACSRLKGVNVHVYESAAEGFTRISCFDSEKAAKTIHVLYQGRMHYDALCPT